MDILGSFTYYRVYLNKIEDPQILEYIRDHLSFEDNNIITTSGNEIDFICEEFNNYKWIDTAIDFGSAQTDFEEVEDWLTEHLGDHSHYLVFAKNCTWNGCSGFKFCDKVTDTLYRKHEATFIFKRDVKDGIEILESSHDVPTGSMTYIFGLTNKEFKQLEDAEFDEIEQFVNERI